MLKDTIGRSLLTFMTNSLLRTALGLTAKILSTCRFYHRGFLGVVLLWMAGWRLGRIGAGATWASVLVETKGVGRIGPGATWADVLVETKGVGDPGLIKRVVSLEVDWRIGILKLIIRIKWDGDSRG